MSRIGKLPITLPASVTVEIEATRILITGPKGKLEFALLPGISIVREENELRVKIENPENAQQKAYWGLTRALVQNMVTGVSEGYTKSLDIL